MGWGLDVSSRSMTATGYHCLVQLNVPEVSPRFTASTMGTRSGLMPIRGSAADASLAISSAPMVVPPETTQKGPTTTSGESTAFSLITEVGCSEFLEQNLR